MDADFTLLSESAIGSPAAFSTAVKPPLSSVDPSHKQSGNITGCLSLDAPESPLTSKGEDADNSTTEEKTLLAGDVSKKTDLSLAESSIGILDLDAIQSDNSSSQLFLTSPLDYHSLQLHLSPTLSIPSTRAPLSSSTDIPSIRVTTSSQEIASSRLRKSKIPIPTRPGASIKSPLKSPLKSPIKSPLRSPRKSNSNGTPHKSLIPRANDVTPAAVTTRASLNTSQTSPALGNGFSNGYLKQMSLGSSLGLPSELLGSLSSSSQFGSDMDSEGDTVRSALASALGMLGASREGGSGGVSAEASLDGIPSLSESGHSLPRDPHDQELPEATPSPGQGGLSSLSVGSPSASIEGLPSTYLNPQDSAHGNDTTDITSFSSHTHQDPVINSETTLVSSSLADSLTEFAGILGKEDGQWEGLNGREGEGQWEGLGVKPEMDEGLGADMYNPFDSYDNAGMQQQFEFKEQNSSSFLAQLDKDEEEIKKFNNSSQLGGTTFSGPGSFADSAGDASLSSYFEKRSNTLGDLTTVKLPPQERPHFTDTPTHVISSPCDPDEVISAPPTSSNIAKATPIKLADGDLNETLKATDIEDSSSEQETRSDPLSNSLTPIISEHTDKGVGPDPPSDSLTPIVPDKGAGPDPPSDSLTPIVPDKGAGPDPPSDSLTPIVPDKGAGPDPPSDSLTPIISEHTPLPAQFAVPKFTLGDSLSPSQMGVMLPVVASEELVAEEKEKGRVLMSEETLKTESVELPLSTTTIMTFPTTVMTSSSVPVVISAPMVPVTPPTSMITLATSSSAHTPRVVTKTQSPSRAGHAGYASRYSPIKAPLSSGESLRGGGGRGSPPVSNASLLQDMQQKLAKFREELEGSRISAETLMSRQVLGGHDVGTTLTLVGGVSSPVASRLVTTATPSISHPAPSVTASVSSATAHPAPSITTSTAHPTPSITTSTAHPAPSITASTAHPAPSVTPSTAHPAPSITPSTAHPAPSITPSTAHPAPSITTSTAHPAPSVTPSTAHPAPSVTPSTAHPTPSITTSTAHPAPSITTSTAHPAPSITASTAHPAPSINTSAPHFTPSPHPVPMVAATPPSPPTSVEPEKPKQVRQVIFSPRKSPPEKVAKSLPDTIVPVMKSVVTDPPSTSTSHTRPVTPRTESVSPPTTSSHTRPVTPPTTSSHTRPVTPPTTSSHTRPVTPPTTSSLTESLARSDTESVSPPSTSSPMQSTSLKSDTESVSSPSTFSLDTPSIPPPLLPAAPSPAFPPPSRSSDTRPPTITSSDTLHRPSQSLNTESKSLPSSSHTLPSSETEPLSQLPGTMAPPPPDPAHPRYSSKLTEQLAKARALFKNLEKMEEAFAESRRNLNMAAASHSVVSSHTHSSHAHVTYSGHAHVMYTSPPLSTSLATAATIPFSPKRVGADPSSSHTSHLPHIPTFPSTPPPSDVPHTTVISPPTPPTSNRHHVTFSSPLSVTPPTSPQTQLTPKRAGAGSFLDASHLHVPEAHLMSEVCCVGSLIVDHFLVTNLSERWLQLNFSVSNLQCDGRPVRGDKEGAVFSLPERSFISPNHSEPIKVTFHPVVPGSYEAVLHVHAGTMLGSGAGDGGRGQDVSLVLKSVAEQPQLELTSGASSGDLLDFGVLVGGATVAMPLELTNRGKSRVPLQLSIASDKPPNKMYFSFKPLPQQLVLSSPPPTSPLQPHTLSLTLPPPPSTVPEPANHSHSIHLCFTAPPKFHSGVGGPDFEPPEVISAQLEMRVNGVKTLPLQIMQLQATVGVARLNVPRALQAISLSCPVGRAVTRDIPVKNMGNIPLHVKLQVGGAGPSHFTVTPTTLSMEPLEGSKLSVCFDPPTAPLISEGQIDIHVEPGGPKYELKLRGTATGPPTPSKGMLACSKYALYWGGVTLGDSKQIEVLLHNSFPTAIPLSLSIRHPRSPFQLEEKEVTLPPHQETPVNVTFFPFSVAVSISALDIYDKLHSKKYRIPLCGYGGVSNLEVGGVNSTPHRLACLDVGEVVAQQGIKLKVLLYNSGPRATFVRATCCKLESSTPLPDSHAHFKPSHLVIAPHSTEQLLLFYRPDQTEEAKCKLSKSPLARMVLESGDELVRQRLVWGVKEDGGAGSLSFDHEDFTKDFTHQEKAMSELDLIAFQLDNIHKIFSEHLTSTTVTLMGSPKSPQKRVQPVWTSGESGVGVTPQQLRHPLSPSYTPMVTQDSSPAHGHTPPVSNSSPAYSAALPVGKLKPQKPSSTHSSSPPSRKKVHKSSPAHSSSPSPDRPKTYHSSPSHSSTPPLGRWKSRSHHSRILSTPLLSLPLTVVSQSSGSFLEVKNPFRNPLHWELSSSVLPFYKESEGAKPVKTSHQVFTIQTTSGTISSESSQKLRVTFRPHNKGVFSQVWTLKVSGPVNLKSKQYGLTFTGQSISPSPPLDQQLTPPPDQITPGGPSLASVGSHDLISKSHDYNLESRDSQKQKQVAQWLFQTQHQAGQRKKTSPTKRIVYLSESLLEFPDTLVGAQSKVKVRLCNRDSVTHSIKVLRPSTPFQIEHTSISLGSRYCARLPVLFCPTEAGHFEAILAIHTQAGHQSFAQLRGKAILDNTN